MDTRIELIREHIRDVPDFPKPGILFRDITPVLANPRALRTTVDVLADRYRAAKLDHIVAIESRGFLFAAPLALELDLPLYLVRKKGKLPGKTDEVSYSLEYGNATLEIQHGEIRSGGKVLVLDDLLATGGTAAAAACLVRGQQGQVVEVAFVIELSDLKGREKLAPTPVHALLQL